MWNFYEFVTLMEGDDVFIPSQQPTDRGGQQRLNQQNQAAAQAAYGKPLGQGPPAAQPVQPTGPPKVTQGPDPEEHLSRPTPGTRASRQDVHKNQAGINRGLKDKETRNEIKLADSIGSLNQFLTNSYGDQVGWTTQAWTVATALAELTGVQGFAKESFFMKPYNNIQMPATCCEIHNAPRS